MQVEMLQKHREFTRGEKPTVPKARAQAMIDIDVARAVETRGRPKKKRD